MSRPRKLVHSALGAALAVLTLLPAQALAGDDYVSDEVVVGHSNGKTEVVKLSNEQSVPEATAELSRRPDVRYAVPNHIAHTADFEPNDPGKTTGGTWKTMQWNFLPDTGINMPAAWANLEAAGRPGGSGVTVAVLDTGVAYSNRGRFVRSPDLEDAWFVRGYDFVSSDPYANDENGHGTHVASTIAESTNNGYGLTGIAYNAKIMPVRVLDEFGAGDAVAIARGIRFAAKRGAQIINLSLEFGTSVTASEIPEIISAINYAHKRGAAVFGAAGNEARSAIAYPAKTRNVVAVGAVTEHLCQAEYSNQGAGLDIVAPGGGADANVPSDPEHCRPDDQPGPDIYQLTLVDESPRKFGYPSGYEGTSMAAPHVSGVAALVIASGVIGQSPKPNAVIQRLEDTARDLGKPGYDTRYGAGMLDAAAATAPVS